MLAAIGVRDVADLFADIPPRLRFGGRLEIPQGIGEADLLRELAELASRNADATRELQFLGGGTYDHYVPACVDLVTGLPQFQTAYTPYQPEVSQGTLTAIFEFQTAICELTGLSVSNASVYDGATAAAEAMGLAVRQTGRARIVVSETVNPETRAVVATYAGGQGIEVVVVPHSGGVSDLDAINEALQGAAALLVQQPGYLGAVEDLPALVEAAHDAGAQALASVDPVSLGLLAAPGELGVDVAVGNGQALGNAQAYGGAALRLLARPGGVIPALPRPPLGGAGGGGRRGALRPPPPTPR